MPLLLEVSVCDSVPEELFDIGSQWFTWGETHKKLGLKELRKRYGDLAIQNLVNID